MARRDNRQVIAIGPAWIDVFRSNDSGGSDGPGAREFLLTCAGDSAFPLEYRFDSPADPTNQQAQLAPGEAFRIEGANQLIHHVVMRGVGGAAIGGVEETTF